MFEMDKRVVLAVAGSGKTYYICNKLNETKRNVIIAYTNENIKNIRKELYSKYGFIPSNTLIMTFHSFVYTYLIRPFDSAIGEFYNVKDFASNGVTVKEPPVPSLIKKGYRVKNPFYNKDNSLLHYIDNKKYYCKYLAKLVLKTKNKDMSLIKLGCNNINKFFDNIYVDEMQDFREENWDLLVNIIKNVKSILLVGDYYQHSVSATNNTGKPFKLKNGYISYSDYIKYLNELNLEVDDKSLIKSRRCSSDVCNFIKDKLNINIESQKMHSGDIRWLLDEKEVKSVLENNNIIKLVWDSPEKYSFNAVTWSYSKGDTYSEVCLILTDKYSDLDSLSFKPSESVISTNKLYVALSRSKGNVFLLKSELYSKFKMDVN